MGFNYASERKKFEQKCSKLRKEYEEAGMNKEAIDLLYQFDLEMFRSERIYARHTQALSSEYINDSESERSTIFRKFVNDTVTFDEADFHGRYAWVDMIENQRLAHLLQQLTDKDLELLTFLVLDEHTQRELAQKWRCSQKVISVRFKRIKNFLRNL